MRKKSINLGTILFAGVLAMLLNGCQTPAKKPAPDYMKEMDRIAMDFGSISEKLRKTGQELTSIEKQRIQLSPGSKEALSDDKLEDKITRLMDVLDREVEGKIIRMAKAFEQNTKVPNTKDKDDREIYKIHNEKMKALFISLLGVDEEKDTRIRTTTSWRDVEVEVRTKSDETQNFNAEELKNKNIFLLFPAGYISLLKDYLNLNLLKLKGYVNVPACTMIKEGKGKYTCNVKERKLVDLLGSPNQYGDYNSETYWNTLFHRTKGREFIIASRIKQLINARKRIYDFERQEDSQ